jgi:hypothetical protein
MKAIEALVQTMFQLIMNNAPTILLFGISCRIKKYSGKDLLEPDLFSVTFDRTTCTHGSESRGAFGGCKKTSRETTNEASYQMSVKDT